MSHNSTAELQTDLKKRRCTVRPKCATHSSSHSAITATCNTFHAPHHMSMIRWKGVLPCNFDFWEQWPSLTDKSTRGATRYSVFSHLCLQFSSGVVRHGFDVKSCCGLPGHEGKKNRTDVEETPKPLKTLKNLSNSCSSTVAVNRQPSLQQHNETIVERHKTEV